MARNDLTTLERVKVHLNAGGADPVGGEDQDFDSFLEELIDSYSASFERYLGRASKDERRTEYFDVEPGQHVFPLAGFPDVSVSTVTLDPDRAWTSGDIDSTEFTVDQDGGLLLVDHGYALTPGNQVLRVIYSGGLGTNTTNVVTNFPDIAHACDLQVVHHFKRRDSIGAQGVSFGDQNVSWQGPLDWLPTARSILDRHRRIRF